MPKRDAALLLEDMRSALTRIGRYTRGMRREEFLADEKTIDAVVRNLEIIGEAVRWLPDDFKSRHADIAWGQIAGLRNRIVHDYFGLDLEIIWQVLQTSLSSFEQQLENLN
jgi:uncharacterized protein with HEPN domain